MIPCQTLSREKREPLALNRLEEEEEKALEEI